MDVIIAPAVLFLIDHVDFDLEGLVEAQYAGGFYVGSQVDWGLNFGTIPPNEAFVGYAERLQARAAYKAAKAIDNALIQELRK